MFRFYIASFFVFTCATQIHPEPRSPYTNPFLDVQRMERGVVKIRAAGAGANKTWRTGSGFVIRKHHDRHLILTVTHVVKDAGTIQVVYRGRRHQPLTAKVQKIQADDPNGLALLEVDRPAPLHTALLYIKAFQRRGAEIIALGFPRGGDPWQLTRGKIKNTQDARIAFSAAVDSGNSGGPLLGSFGHVIGIITSTRAGTGYAMNAVSIEKILSRWDIALPRPPALPQKSLAYANLPRKTWKDLSLYKFIDTREHFLPADEIDASGKLIQTEFNAPFGQISKEDFESKKRALLLRDGRLLVHLRDRQALRWKLVFMDRSGRRTGKEIVIPAAFERMIELTNGELLGLEAANKKFGDEDENDPTHMRAVRINLETGTVLNTSEYIETDGIVGLVAAEKSSAYLVGARGRFGLFAMVGAERSRQFILKLNGKGAVVARYDIKSRFGGVTALSRASSGHLFVAYHKKPVSNGDRIAEESQILKFDSNLKLLWRRNLSLAGTWTTKPRNVWGLKDGHAIAISHDTISDAIRSGAPAFIESIVLLDPRGKILWRKQISPENEENFKIDFYYLRELPSGRFLLGGEAGPERKMKSFLFALNRDGEFSAP